MAMSGGDEQPRRTDAETSVTIGRFRYLRAPQPVRFPESAEMPETKLHLELRTLLYQLLSWAFAKEAQIGCDQFVYWDPTDPRACLAPDAFVRLGSPDTNFRTWKVWEWGAPELAVEILSRSDEGDSETWSSKLQKYARLGVRELVAFDPESSAPRLRVWDWLEGDLVERELSGSAASNVLPGYWLEVVDPKLGPTLRLSRDAAGAALFPTRAEAEAEARRLETQARESAEARVRELEAELARGQG